MGDREIVFTVREWEGAYVSDAAGTPGTEFRSDVWAVRPDGMGLRRVTALGKGTGNGQWHPSGEFICFQSNVTGDYEVYRCRADGSEVTNLTRSPGTEDYGFQLSSDGQHVVYASQVKGQPAHVAVMNADGSGQRAIVDQACSYMGRFLPDGRSVVYVSLRPSYGVYRCDLDGSNERCLMREDGVDYHNPVPSPDGRYVICFRRTGGVSAIWRMDADGADAQPLTTGNTHDTFYLGAKDLHGGSDPPSWSPDSQRVAYATGEPSQIWTMACDGSDKRQVCRRDTPCGYAQWLPAGRRLAFVSWVGERPQLFVVDASGGEPNQLTKLTGAVLWPR